MNIENPKINTNSIDISISTFDISLIDFSQGIPKSLIRIADQVFNDFLADSDNFFTQLSENKLGLVDWNLSNIANRNNFTSKLFDYLFYIELVLKLINSGQIPKRIIFDREELSRPLQEYLNKGNIPIEVYSSSEQQNVSSIFLLSKFKFFLKYFRFLFRIIRIWFKRWKAARIFPKLAPNIDLIFVDTYLSRNSVSKVFGSQDHYYRDFEAILEKEELNQIYIIFTPLCITDWKEFYFSLKRHHLNFLAKERYLGIFDFLYTFLYPLRFRKFKFPKANYKGIDLSALVSHLRNEEAFDPNVIEALLNYRFIKKISKKGIKIKCFLDWYENQWFGRGLHLGFHRFYPNTPSVGYMSYPPQSFQYNLRLLKIDQKAGVLPKKIWIIGAACLKYFDPNDLGLGTEISTSFRSKYIENLKIDQKNKTKVVIAFPYYEGQIRSRLIELCIMLKAFLCGLNKECKLYAKLHPTMAIEEQSYLKEHVEIYEGTAEELLSETSVLIGTGSSICLEALACFIPVIIAGGVDSYTLNPILQDISPEIYSICYKDEEYFDRLEYYLSPEFAKLKKEKLCQDFAYVKQQYFAPFNANKIRNMLGLPALDVSYQ